MLRLLMTTVTVGLFIACAYLLAIGNMDGVITLSLFGLFTNEATKALFPAVMILRGVNPNARQ